MKHYIIGRILEDGTVEKGSTEQGWIYKDSKAFYDKTNKVCYIPELGDDIKYVYADFLTLACDNEEVAEEIFNKVDWQTPEVLVEEWLRDDELHICTNCEHMFLSYGVEHCPNCGQRKVKDMTQDGEEVVYHYEIDEIDYAVTMHTQLMKQMNWTWESLIFAYNDELFAVVENKATGEKTCLTTHGEVRVLDANKEQLSIDEIIKLAKEDAIYGEKYDIDCNNWFSLEYCYSDSTIADDDVFEATPKTCAELADLLIESHLRFFER